MLANLIFKTLFLRQKYQALTPVSPTYPSVSQRNSGKIIGADIRESIIVAVPSILHFKKCFAILNVPTMLTINMLVCKLLSVVVFCKLSSITIAATINSSHILLDATPLLPASPDFLSCSGDYGTMTRAHIARCRAAAEMLPDGSNFVYYRTSGPPGVYRLPVTETDRKYSDKKPSLFLEKPIPLFQNLVKSSNLLVDKPRYKK